MGTWLGLLGACGTSRHYLLCAPMSWRLSLPPRVCPQPATPSLEGLSALTTSHSCLQGREEPNPSPEAAAGRGISGVLACRPGKGAQEEGGKGEKEEEGGGSATAKTGRGEAAAGENRGVEERLQCPVGCLACHRNCLSCLGLGHPLRLQELQGTGTRGS